MWLILPSYSKEWAKIFTNGRFLSGHSFPTTSFSSGVLSSGFSFFFFFLLGGFFASFGCLVSRHMCAHDGCVEELGRIETVAKAHFTLARSFTTVGVFEWDVDDA
jgi:hypothetical protein